MARKPKNKLLAILNERIWYVRLEDRHPIGAFFIKQLRIILIVSRNFTRDKLQMQAAGLTYYTLLSIVPVVALVFAIAKGFGFQEKLEDELLKLLKGHEEVVEQIMVFAVRLLENTQGGVLAGIGVAVLLWSVMRLLANIELSFNDIWQVQRGRSWIRKFTEYFSIMLVAPLIIVVSSSITVLINTEVEGFVSGTALLDSIGPYIFMLIRFLPYFLTWLLFTFIYMVIPNTRVNFGSAFIAGIIAGTCYQMLEWGYVNFQVGVSRYNAIYGSFAALPLFLIWVNLNWLVTLIGAEIAFANQFVTEIENEVDSKRMSNIQRHVTAMVICKQIADRFERDLPPITAQELAKLLKLPYGVTSKILDLLEEANILIGVEWEANQGQGYLPARSMDKLRVSDIMEALDRTKHAMLPSMEHGELKVYLDAYETYREEARKNTSNRLIKDLPKVLPPG